MSLKGKSSKGGDELGMSTKNGRSAKGSLHRLDSHNRFKLGLTTYDLFIFLMSASLGGHFTHWNGGLHSGFASFCIMLGFVLAAYISLGYSMTELSVTFPYSGGIFGFGRVTLGYYASYMCASFEIFHALLLLAIASITLGDLVHIIHPTEMTCRLKPLVWIVYLCMTAFAVMFGKNFWRLQQVFCIIVALLYAVFIFGSLKFVDFSQYAGYRDMVHSVQFGESSGVILNSNLVSSHPSRRWFVGGISSALEALPRAAWFFLGVPCAAVSVDDLEDSAASLPTAVMRSYVLLGCLSITVLFIYASLPPALSAAGANALDPLSAGYVAMFPGIGVNISAILSLPAVMISGLPFIFWASKLIFALSHSKILSRHFQRRDAVSGAPYVSIVCSGAICTSFCFLAHYLTEFWQDHGWNFGPISFLFNLSILSSGCLHLAQCICFVYLQTKFRTLPRPFKSPLGIFGALYAGLVWILMIISVVVFQHDGHLAFYVFVGVIVILTAFYHVFAKRGQIISKYETRVLFTAHVVNYNLKKSRKQSGVDRDRGSPSSIKLSGSQASDSGRTPSLVRMLTPNSLSNFFKQDGKEIDLSFFLTNRSNFSPRRSFGSDRNNMVVPAYSPSSNIASSTRDLSSDSNGSFFRMFSKKDSAESFDSNKSRSRFGYFMSSSARSVKSSHQRQYIIEEDDERDNSSPPDNHQAIDPAPEQIDQGAESRPSESSSKSKQVESNEIVIDNPTSTISTKSAWGGGNNILGSIIRGTAKGSKSTTDPTIGRNTSIGINRNASNTVSRNFSNSMARGTSNIIGRNISGAPANQQISRNSSSNSNIISRNSSSAASVFSRNSSNAAPGSISGGLVPRDCLEFVEDASVAAVDYNLLLQGFEVDELVKHDPIYAGPFAQEFRRAVIEATGGGEFGPVLDEIYSDDEDDDLIADNDDFIQDIICPPSSSKSAGVNDPAPYSEPISGSIKGDGATGESTPTGRKRGLVSTGLGFINTFLKMSPKDAKGSSFSFGSGQDIESHQKSSNSQSSRQSHSSDADGDSSSGSGNDGLPTKSAPIIVAKRVVLQNLVSKEDGFVDEELGDGDESPVQVKLDMHIRSKFHAPPRPQVSSRTEISPPNSQQSSPDKVSAVSSASPAQRPTNLPSDSISPQGSPKSLIPQLNIGFSRSVDPQKSPGGSISSGRSSLKSSGSHRSAEGFIATSALDTENPLLIADDSPRSILSSQSTPQDAFEFFKGNRERSISAPGPIGEDQLNDQIPMLRSQSGPSDAPSSSAGLIMETIIEDESG